MSFRKYELTMPNREIDALTTPDLWALRRAVMRLLVDRMTRRSKELDALIAHLTPGLRSARKVGGARRHPVSRLRQAIAAPPATAGTR